ncbi:MAG: hypothetical protein QM754_17460 [Tepidisphaeraceae bacterium]
MSFELLLPMPLGEVTATPAALDALNRAKASPLALIARHRAGDWGDVCDQDSRANDDALRHGGRIVSAYAVSLGVRVWVITESDREATTILLPAEY